MQPHSRDGNVFAPSHRTASRRDSIHRDVRLNELPNTRGDHQTPLCAIALITLILLVGCNGLDVVPEPLRPDSRHQEYAKSLEKAGLAQSALVRAWTSAADGAIQDSLKAQLPVREMLYFDPARPTAYGYRLDLQAGQRLAAHVEFDEGSEDDGPPNQSTEVAEPPPDLAGWFLDLFLWREPEDGAPRAIRFGEAKIDESSGVMRLEHVVRQDATYVLRLQSELLKGGRATLAVRADGVLEFPVAGGRERDIGSRFGAPRDGGSRRHHGVDIFARRGTPAIAAAAGRVSRVGTNRLGGKTVWMRTDGGLALYYAHLDSQSVQTGQRVAAGDEIGRVGNTGNARTTPPHLHFGVYRNGPRDPSPYLARSPEAGPPGLAPESLGTWRRTRVSVASLRSGPTSRSETIEQLERGTATWVEGLRTGWYRVLLPDGRRGYLAASATESTDRPLRRAVLGEGTAEVEGLRRTELTRRPSGDATPIAQITSDEEVAVLGRFRNAELVRAGGGIVGWMRLAP